LKSPGAGPAVAALARFAAQLGDGLAGHAWLAGDKYSLADAAALPYMVRARALQLSSLWAERGEVAAWLERGLEHASGLGLSDVWGSPSFHAMVANYANTAAQEIQQLLSTTRK